MNRLAAYLKRVTLKDADIDDYGFEQSDDQSWYIDCRFTKLYNNLCIVYLSDYIDRIHTKILWQSQA